MGGDFRLLDRVGARSGLQRGFKAVFGGIWEKPEKDNVENSKHFCDFWQVCFFKQKFDFGTPIFSGSELGKRVSEIDVPNQKSWQVCQTCQKYFFGTQFLAGLTWENRHFFRANLFFKIGEVYFPSSVTKIRFRNAYFSGVRDRRFKAKKKVFRNRCYPTSNWKFFAARRLRRAELFSSRHVRL